MRLPDSWVSANPWREFFDTLSDAVLVLDLRARVVFANRAALGLLHCAVAAPLHTLEGALGAGAVRWLTRAAGARTEPASPPPLVQLAGGRAASLAWRRLDARHSAVRLQLDPGPHIAMPSVPDGLGADGVREAIRLFWDSPFPATLQGTDFRLLDVNPAFVDFSGYSREQLVGRDPLDLLAPGDQSRARETRRTLQASFGRTDLAALSEGRLVDGAGRERWFRVARRVLVDGRGESAYFALMQDTTAERVARERAERSVRELDDWFDLSPVGMVLFDQAGLLLRSNQAFDALVGRLPERMREAPESVQHLLGWQGGAAIDELQPGATPWRSCGWVARAGHETLRLCSIVRCFDTAAGQRRYMAVVEDRSVEEERDLAQVQIGALMDTAGVGIATFQESSGWVRQRAPQTRSADAAPPSAALQSISRDIVARESIGEYDKLQAALRLAQRAEVRYAIDHAELGRRWLLTRVEPATLASGKRTTSVVTLDVTEQHRSQQRGEQLLREMTTILESTTAGIAYLRGEALVRCNARFEAMLGLPSAVAPGTSLEALFSRHPDAGRIALDGLRQVAPGAVWETELDVSEAGGRWYALSVRRAGAGADPMESVAVLSDVTRMKMQQLELEMLARDRELMFSLSEVGIAFVRDQRIQRANQAMAELSGWTALELSAQELESLFVDEGESAGRRVQEDRDLRAHGRWSGERQLRRSDGRTVWVQVSKRLVDRGDESAGIIVSYVDVDARYRAERAVALQAERTRSILDSVLVGIVNVGPDGIEWMNRSARRMFGGNLADFLGEPIATVATPEPEHPFRRTRYLEDLAEGRAETFECRVRARDGREFWVVGNAVVTDREGNSRQLTYALLDIERRRQAEARMSQAQTALQQVIAAAPLAIVLIEARSFTIVQLNELAASAVGLTPEQMVGRTPGDIFPPWIAVARERDLRRALAAGVVTSREYRVDADPDRNLPARVWDARYVPIGALGEGPPEQLLLVATDVTEQRAAQEARLEAALAQRDMLVKEVHHRIKNNLQGVAGLLQQTAQRKPEVAEAVSEVVGQVHAIAQVYGLQVGAQGPLPVVGVIEAIAGSVQRNFGHAIRCDLGAARDWALPESEAIPIALTVNELLTNAIKHSKSATGEIACEISAGADGVTVTISNVAALPPGFGLARIPGSVSGLGLVRALLPRRHAALTIEQQGARVVAAVALRRPVVTRLEPLPSPTIRESAALRRKERTP